MEDTPPSKKSPSTTREKAPRGETGEKDADLMAACTGPELGDEDSGYEYFSPIHKPVQGGKGISPEYREAYSKIINDISAAIVTQRKR